MDAIQVEIQQYGKSDIQELTDETAMDEIVADFTADFIENTDKFSQFVNQNEENRSWGRKILDWFKKVIADIKARFNSQTERNRAATSEFAFKLSDLEVTAKKWEAAWKASEKSVKNAPVQETALEESPKYSIKKKEYWKPKLT